MNKVPINANMEQTSSKVIASLTYTPPLKIPADIQQTKSDVERQAYGESSSKFMCNDNREHMTTAQLHAQAYLGKRKIFQLFNFLIGHLLVDEPVDPIEYLSDLLDKCILFRSGLKEPPLLFTPRHIQSMFQSLDPGGSGSISLEQYKTGMTTLGICCYDPCPSECTPGRVDQQTFEKEAKRCLEQTLAEIVGKTD